MFNKYWLVSGLCLVAWRLGRFTPWEAAGCVCLRAGLDAVKWTKVMPPPEIGRFQIWTIIPTFSWRYWGIPRNTSVNIASLLSKFEPWISQIWIMISNLSNGKFVKAFLAVALNCWRGELLAVLWAVPLVRRAEHVYTGPLPLVRSDIINLVTISAALRQWWPALYANWTPRDSP